MVVRNCSCSQILQKDDEASLHGRILHDVKMELKCEGGCDFVLFVELLKSVMKDLVRIVGWHEDSTLAIQDYLWWIRCWLLLC